MADVTEESSGIYVFDGYRLDRGKRLLFDTDGAQVSLVPKAFDILVYLVTNANRVVEKDELMSAIWPDTVVEENNLTQNVSSIRKALGERLKENRFIATIPGRGYKFVADVHQISPENGRPVATPDLAPLSPPASSIRFPYVVGASVLALAVVALGVFLLRPADSSPAPATPITSIAVLPFKPIALDRRDESLEMGMADTLILKLSDVGPLKVRPFTAVRRFAAPDQDAVAAGKDLRVDAVLDGRLQLADNRIRATVQLLRVSDGEQLWSGQFDEKLTDIFALQDSIARKVAGQLSLTLGRRGSKKYTSSVEAYQSYMRGNLHARRLVKAEVEKGIEHYDAAIKADPSFALAYIELANAHRALVLSSDEPPLEQMPKAKTAATKAVEIDPELPEAWASMAVSHFWYDWNWKAAEENFQKALQLDPGNAPARLFYAHLLSNIGRHDEALGEVRRAREMEPANLLTNAVEGQILFFAGRKAESEQTLKRTIDLDPNFWLPHLFLARLYLADGRFDDAAAAAKRAVELSGGSAEGNASMAFAMARSGRKDEARSILDELMQRAKTRYVPRYAIAQVHLALGDRETAINELDQAYTGREALMVFLKVEPKWDELRNEPRFMDLLKRMNL